MFETTRVLRVVFRFWYVYGMMCGYDRRRERSCVEIMKSLASLVNEVASLMKTRVALMKRSRRAKRGVTPLFHFFISESLHSFISRAGGDFIPAKTKKRLSAFFVLVELPPSNPNLYFLFSLSRSPRQIQC